MTFLQYIDSVPRAAINHIPKVLAPLLIEAYPDRFPNDPASNDSIQSAVEFSSGSTFNCDFRNGQQYSYLSIQDYDDRCSNFIDAHIEWNMLEFDFFSAPDDPDIDFENII